MLVSTHCDTCFTLTGAGCLFPFMFYHISSARCYLAYASRRRGITYVENLCMLPK